MANKPKPLAIKDFTGGLNLTQDTAIGDNQFTILKNFYYNKNKQLETRRGYRTFGPSIGSNPITSYYFYQRDDDLTRHALCTAGSVMYKYDGSAWNSVASNLAQYETIPGLTTNRTRWDFATYKNDAYMFNGVDPYLKYTSSTGAVSEIGMVGAVTCTFDHTTDIVVKVAHGLANGDEVRFTTSGALPAGITAYQFYYIVNKNNDDFQISKTKGGTALTFSDNGSGTNQYNKTGKPRCRYIDYMGDRLYAAGDDANPISLYYTAAAPADGTTISANTLVVGGDENGRINGLKELGQVILVFKSGKIYSINVATPSALPIDAHNGGYCDRSIAAVENAIVYFTNNGIDILKARDAVTGVGALASNPLGEAVAQLTDQIENFQFNSGCAIYNPGLNNYYFAFDTNNDNIPDKVLVYSTLTKGWSEFVYPPLYDFGFYINSDNDWQYLFASAVGGQMFQFDYGFDDAGAAIEYQLKSKLFDFGTPGLNNDFDYIDLIGYASLDSEIAVSIEVDGGVVAESTITSDNLVIDTVAKTLGVVPIGTSTLTGEASTTDIDLYKFTFRVPMFAMGGNIAFDMSSTGGVWILEQARISRNGEPEEVFNTANYG